MKRISPEEVLSAYQKTGMGVQVEYLYVALTESKPQGCGLGALCVDKFNPKTYEEKKKLYLSSLEEVATLLGLSLTYTKGFATGFDGGPLSLPLYKPKAHISYGLGTGYQDGIDAHLHVIANYNYKHPKAKRK